MNFIVQELYEHFFDIKAVVLIKTSKISVIKSFNMDIIGNMMNLKVVYNKGEAVKVRKLFTFYFFKKVRGNFYI